MRVGLLGCGNVGGALVAAARRRTPTPSRPAPASASSWPRWRCAASPRSATRLGPAGRADHTTPPPSVDDPDVDVVVEVIGGIEPARGLILDGPQGRQAGRHRQQGAARQRRRRAVRGGGRGRRRPALRGGGRRRHPADPAAAGVAGRRADPPGHGHRQRHDQLHPDPHDRGGRLATPTPWPRPRASGYAERDPTADVEGYDAAAKAAILASIAFGVRVVAGDVYREGISAITADDIAFAGRLGYVVKLLAVDRARRDDERDRRAGPPGDGARRPIRWRRCGTRSTPCSSKATPSAS